MKEIEFDLGRGWSFIHKKIITNDEHEVFAARLFGKHTPTHNTKLGLALTAFMSLYDFDNDLA